MTVAVVSASGTLYLIELGKLLAGTQWDEALRLEISAHEGEPSALAISADGRHIATSSIGEPVRLWDAGTGELIDEFGGDPGEGRWHAVDFHPTKPWMLVASHPNRIRIYTLDIDELIAIAESRLTRELTEAECQLYRGACPTQ